MKIETRHIPTAEAEAHGRRGGCLVQILGQTNGCTYAQAEAQAAELAASTGESWGIFKLAAVVDPESRQKREALRTIPGSWERADAPVASASENLRQPSTVAGGNPSAPPSISPIPGPPVSCYGDHRDSIPPGFTVATAPVGTRFDYTCPSGNVEYFINSDGRVARDGYILTYDRRHEFFADPTRIRNVRLPAKPDEAAQLRAELADAKAELAAGTTDRERLKAHVVRLESVLGKRKRRNEMAKLKAELAEANDIASLRTKLAKAEAVVAKLPKWEGIIRHALHFNDLIPASKNALFGVAQEMSALAARDGGEQKGGSREA